MAPIPGDSSSLKEVAAFVVEVGISRTKFILFLLLSKILFGVALIMD